MGGKITNKRGSHIKEAYDVVGDISTRSTLARMTRILRLNRPYKCLKLGGELHLEMGKISVIFLVFSALRSLGSCALDDFLCIWRSVGEEESSTPKTHQISRNITRKLKESDFYSSEY